MPDRPLFRYYGGKWNLAPSIIGYFPKHRVYVESFGGAASVLMRKRRSFHEVYNDVDDEIVEVFRVMRNPEQAEELRRRLALTPYSRREFEQSYEGSPDPIEKARKLIVRSFMGFSSASVSKAHKTGFRSDGGGHKSCSADWMGYAAHVDSFCRRLQGVTIECQPAHDVIRRYDAPDALHFVDPPYPWGTRSPGASYRDCYRHEMSDEDHIHLAKTLRDVQGMVVLCTYSGALYDELYHDWTRITMDSYTFGRTRERTECILLNAAAADHSQLPLL